MSKTTGKITTMSSTKTKETIYVDVDDEITAIIEKVTNAKGSIIALVLPKRAVVLQSVVNMRLLKRSTDQAKKHLVLVTGEANLLPIAGIAGVHVASTITSKPAVPNPPDMPDEDDLDSVEEPDMLADDDFDKTSAAAIPIGALADNTMAKDNAVSEDMNVTNKPNVSPVKRDKKLVVPSFNRFRKRFALGALGLVGLLIFLYAALAVWPSATIAIETDSSTIKPQLNVTLDTKTTEVDVENSIIPAFAASVQKTITQSVPATGEQNTGEKAKGKVTVTNCTDNPVTIPAGSSFSIGGKTFISQDTLRAPGSNFSSVGDCKEDGKDTVDVVAIRAGAEFNVAAGTATFAQSSSTVTGYASQATGGTDVIVKVITQADVDAAKAKVAAQEASAVREDLSRQLEDKGYIPVDVTFLPGEQKVTTNANVGDKADTLTITSVVPYSLLGYKPLDMREIVEDEVYREIDKEKQKISDDGLENASYAQESPGTAESAVVSVKLTVIAGPTFDVGEIIAFAKGKKANEIKESYEARPGVTKTEVQYSPFWVQSVPSNEKKITVIIDGKEKT